MRPHRGPEHFAALPRLPSPGKSLTWREIRVLVLVAEGLTNDQIGRKLDYRPSTVSTMVRRIYCKLAVANRAAAVDQGWRRGYLAARVEGRLRWTT